MHSKYVYQKRTYINLQKNHAMRIIKKNKEKKNIYIAKNLCSCQMNGLKRIDLVLKRNETVIFKEHASSSFNENI